MRKRQPQQVQEATTQIPLYPNLCLSQGATLVNGEYYLNSYCSHLLQLSNNIIQQLLISEQLFKLAMGKGFTVVTPPITDVKSDGNSTASYLGSPQISLNHHAQVRNIILSNKKSKAKEEFSQSESFKPQIDAQENWNFYNTNTSKKIVRDYNKAIFDFILDNSNYVSRLLASLDVKQTIFIKQLQKYKGKVNSHLQLKAMFAKLEPKFAKALRIITFQYSRRHQISDIFSIYTFNYHRHLKYRSKILRNLKEPFSAGQTIDF